MTDEMTNNFKTGKLNLVDSSRNYAVPNYNMTCLNRTKPIIRITVRNYSTANNINQEFVM